MASNDPAYVLNNGHGIPQMHLVHPGVSIYFWAGPTDLLETEWGQLQASIENGKELLDRHRLGFRFSLS